MNLLGYRTNIKSASEVSDDNIARYDYLAQLIVNQDDNANGDAELRFVDRDGIRQPVIINGWTLSSQAKMKYWWGQSTIELNITSPSGLSQVKNLEIKVGSRSIYWGVETLSKVMSYFLDLNKAKSWEYKAKQEELETSKNRLNAILLEAERLKVEVAILQSDLRALE